MVTINLFRVVLVGGDNTIHVLTVRQIEEEDNCSKQVRDTAIKTFWKTEEKKHSGKESGEQNTVKCEEYTKSTIAGARVWQVEM